MRAWDDRGHDTALGDIELTVRNQVYEQVELALFLNEASHNTVVNHRGTLDDAGADNTFVRDDSFDPERVKAQPGLEPAFADILQR